MFKIGEAETKVSVTVWKGALKVHLRKFWQSSFHRGKWYPSKQGIALTLQEWNDLKRQIQEIDEVIDCSQIVLEEDRERPRYERQLAVSEDSNVEGNFNAEEIIQKLMEVSEEAEQETQKLKRTLSEDHDTNANFAFEFQGAEQEMKKLRTTPPGDYDTNANFAFEFQN